MAESDTSRGPVSRGGIARHPFWAVGAVLLGAFLANFDTRLTSIGLPDLRGGFSLGFDEGAWLSTAAIGTETSCDDPLNRAVNWIHSLSIVSLRVAVALMLSTISPFLTNAAGTRVLSLTRTAR